MVYEVFLVAALPQCDLKRFFEKSLTHKAFNLLIWNLAV
jgi:hypothetical protein